MYIISLTCVHPSVLQTGDALELCGDQVFHSLSSVDGSSSMTGDMTGGFSHDSHTHGPTHPLLSIPWRAILTAMEMLQQRYVDRETILSYAHDKELNDMLEELRTSRRRNKV